MSSLRSTGGGMYRDGGSGGVVGDGKMLGMSDWGWTTLMIVSKGGDVQVGPLNLVRRSPVEGGDVRKVREW
ncbi:hypothetical protein Tco_0658900 [Tanacetum coccineum]